jgi:hypothetical protein
MAGTVADRATSVQQLLIEAARDGLTTNLNPLARDPRDNDTFGPGHAFLPAALDPVRPDSGRPEPRGTQYDLSWNMRLGGDRHIPWQILRDAADNVDIIRGGIQVRKKAMKRLKGCWSVSAEAIQEAYEDDPHRGHDDIAAELRKKYGPDIKRLNRFWANPWRGHLKSLKQWVNMLQEENIVLDAVAIYPQRDGYGRVHSFRIIDGTTIKPLLNAYGHTPAPPYPAFQQILYGFPRGEYTATPVLDDDGNPVTDATGQPVLEEPFDSDELFYWRDNTRTFSPYGQSDVERALISASLYLKRQGWMVAEYTDGATPVTWLVPEGVGADQVDPRQRRKWEDALNEEMGGRTRARHRIKVAPPGFKPEMMANEAERYKPEYDLHLIKLVALHLGVNIAELGFTEAKGLGSSGYHEGQADVQDRNGRKPDSEMIADIIMELSRTYLDVPEELEFAFTGLEAEDEGAADEVADRQVKGARRTLNEDRRRLGQPLYGFPEADMPFIATQRGLIFLEGASALAPPGELVQPAQGAPPAALPPRHGTDPEATGEPGAEQDDTAPAPGPDDDTDPAAKTGGPPDDGGKTEPPDTTAAKAAQPGLVPGLSAEQVAEIVGFRRFTAKRGHEGGRRFVFKALTEQQAVAAGLVTAGRAEFAKAGEPERPKV